MGANVRSVMKQVTKLASGAGVKHTIRDDYFCEGRPIDMTTDFMALKQEANEFLRPEDDPGHGWLLNHPIGKCIIFQRHLFEQRAVPPQETATAVPPQETAAAVPPQAATAPESP